jgi:hypothetical protein
MARSTTRGGPVPTGDGYRVDGRSDDCELDPESEARR